VEHHGYREKDCSHKERRTVDSWGIQVDVLPGGDSHDETDRDARQKIRIKPLKETNLGVAKVLFEP